MDGGAWWATVHGVAKSRTRLSNFTFTFHFHSLEKKVATHSTILAWRITGMGGAWWAAVYGVSQSRTRLRRLSSSSRAMMSDNTQNIARQGCSPLQSLKSIVLAGKHYIGMIGWTISHVTQPPNSLSSWEVRPISHGSKIQPITCLVFRHVQPLSSVISLAQTRVPSWITETLLLLWKLQGKALSVLCFFILIPLTSIYYVYF